MLFNYPVYRNRSLVDHRYRNYNLQLLWVVPLHHTSNMAYKMGVPNLNHIQVSRLAVVAREVRLIRDQEALGPWMIETVDQPLQGPNTLPYHLHPSMQKAQHQQWALSIQRGVMVV